MKLKSSKFLFHSKPFPEETLYSFISRTIFEHGFKKTHFSSKSFFGLFSQRLSENPILFDLFYHSTEEDFDELYNHSSFEYYFSAHRLKRQEYLLNQLRFQPRNFSAKDLGMMTLSKLIKYQPYYCPKCFRKDIKEYGMPYFHTIHQWEGISICPYHFVNLKPSTHQGFSILHEEDYFRPIPACDSNIRLAKLALEFNGLTQEGLFHLYRKYIFTDDWDEQTIYNHIRDQYSDAFLAMKGVYDLESHMGLNFLNGLESFYLHPFLHLLIWDSFDLSKSLYIKDCHQNIYA